jgi:hypothetical protein
MAIPYHRIGHRLVTDFVLLTKKDGGRERDWDWPSATELSTNDMAGKSI